MKSFYRVISLLLAVLLISGIAVVSVSADSEAEVISGTFEMDVPFSTDVVTETYYYCDDYFSKSANTYDAHLSTMSAALAFTMTSKLNNPDKRYGKLPKEIGFDSIETHDMDKTGTSTMGVLFANKVINDRPVVMVALRGDGYEGEWANNFLCGNSGDAEGFYNSAEKVFALLRTYLSNNGITNPKFWVTGYSRGGAVADLLGKRLNNYYGTQEDIYVYTIEAPKASAEASSCANIHNVSDCVDLITYVYPEIWGMYNSGSVHQLGDADATIMSKQLSLFDPSYMSDYKEVNLKDYLKDLADFLGTNISRETYVDKVQENVMGIAQIYFGLDSNKQTEFVDFFKAVMTKFKDDMDSMTAVIALMSATAGQEEIDNLVSKIIKQIDAVVDEQGSPLTDDQLTLIKNAVQPLAEAVVPVLKADLAGVVSDEPDALPALYYIMTAAGNMKEIIEHHYNYNVFELLKAEDSYYNDTEVTVKADKKTINVTGTTKVTATVTNEVGSTTFTTSDSKIASIKVSGNTATVTGKSAGTATITATNKGVSASVKIKVVKKSNPMKVSAKKTVTANSKKKTTIKKAVIVKKAQGKLTFKTNNKKVIVKNDKINLGEGKMIIAKGLKKGKTYKVKVTVKSAGSMVYKAKSKTVTVKIKVK